MSKSVLGWGAALDGGLILATQYLGWSGDLYYLWGALAVVWGIIILKQK